MALRVHGIATDEVVHLRNGAADANGQPAQRQVADAGRNPCRHCLGFVEEGDDMLVLGYRPFGDAQPYAETGPIFLHADDCPLYDGDRLPDWFEHLDPAVIRGYDRDDVIVYETGDIVRGPQLTESCLRIFRNAGVDYIHIRSKFNCFQCRVERG